MSVASVGLGVAKFLRERKGIKEEQTRYEREQEALKELRDLQKRQAEQSMSLDQEKAERERGLWFPGRKETTGFTGALPYTVKGEEPGINIQRLQTQLEGEKKELGGYESPETRRAAEQDWEKQMANLRHQHAIELADLKKGQTGAEIPLVPFGETGNFNTEIFANISDLLYPGYTFRAVVDNIGMDKVKEQIRFEAIKHYGQNDPAKVKQIESSLDEWLRILFQMAETLPEGEKNRSFGEVISKFGAWLTTPIGGEPRLTRREISKIPKMEEGPPIGVEFPAQTESTQVPLPTIEDQERKIQGLYAKDKGIFKKRKDQTRGLTGIMMGH